MQPQHGAFTHVEACSASWLTDGLPACVCVLCVRVCSARVEAACTQVDVATTAVAMVTGVATVKSR